MDETTPCQLPLGLFLSICFAIGNGGPLLLGILICFCNIYGTFIYGSIVLIFYTFTLIVVGGGECEKIVVKR